MDDSSLPVISANCVSLEELAAAREKSWVARSARGLEVLRWKEGFDVLEHPRLLKASSFRDRIDKLGILDGEIREWWDQVLPCVEGEERRRMRVSLAGLFRPMNVAKLQGKIGEIIAGVLDEIEDPSDVDAMREIAWKIPPRLYCHLVSAPQELASTVARISDSVLGPVFMGDVSRRQESIDAFMESVDLVRTHLTARRDSLTDDFTSIMIKQHLDGMLTDNELISESVSLMQASVDSTVHQMGIVMAELMGRPEVWQRLVDDPSLIPLAVEEVIRFRPRWGTTYRQASEDIEIHGQPVPKDSWIFVSVRGGNRDAAVFEDPDTFKIDRPKTRALMFGGGEYNCVGQHTARLEYHELLRALVKRFPKAHVKGDWTWHDTNPATEVTKLNISLN